MNIEKLVAGLPAWARKEVSRWRSNPLARSSGWMFLGQGASVIFQGAYFVLLGRLLGSTEYGIFAGAVALVSIVSQYSTFGSDFVFIQYVSPNYEEFGRYWGNILMSTLGLGSLFALLLTWIGPHLAHSYPRHMLMCVAISECLCAQTTVACGRVFLAFEKTRMTAGLNLLTNLLRVILALGLLWSLHRATASEWVVVALIVSTIAAVAAVSAVSKAYGRPRFAPRLLLQRVSEGGVFALSYSTAGIYNNIDKAMLGHYGMNMANGIYTMAYRVVDICTMPLYSIQSAAFPRFFRKGVDGVRSTAEYGKKILKRTAFLGLAGAAGMFLFAPIIPHLVGKSFSESVSALRWLCLIPFFRSFHLSAGDALSGSGRQRLRLTTQSIAAGFNFAINLILIPKYSWQGAAWSSLMTDGGLGILNWLVLAICLMRSRRREPAAVV